MKDLKRTNMERSPGADPSVTMLLRAAYAPPHGDGYWEGFESRIMSRIAAGAEAVTPWWSVMAEWKSVGLIAATITLLVTGATVMRDMALERQASSIAARAAYFNADNIPEGVPVTITVGRRRGADDLPARYLNPFEP